MNGKGEPSASLKKQKEMTVLAFLKLLGCLGLLMYGMKLLGEGLQKMAGNQLRHVVDTLTTNRFTSLLTGALVALIIQSSTATSVMTIGFVHAGMFTFVQGLSVIMGASVGNTLIAWLMAAEFNFSLSNYVYPLLAVAICLIYSRNHRSAGESLFGICFLFLGLGWLYIFAAEADPAANERLARFLSSAGSGYGSHLLFLLAGGALTMLVRSSAALMAASMILCSTGVLSIYSGVALVMGENIGRALLTWRAAASAGRPARRTGLAQLVFNLSGVAWAFWVFPLFVEAVCGWVHYDPAPSSPDHSNLAYVLAAFHTCFSLCNVLLFIGLIKPLERLSDKLVTPSEEGEEEESELKYIRCGLLTTPELSVLEARKEIKNYADLTCKMFMQVQILTTVTQDNEFNQLFTRIEKYESVSDDMEVEIANYLNEVSNDRLSDDTKNQIRCMLREISEIESIGDSCYNIARTVSRKFRNKEPFTPQQLEHLHQMFQLTDQALQEMNRLLGGKHIPREAGTSFYIEKEINNFRKQLRSLNIIDINNHAYTYHIGAMYMDIINECEKLADYVINVVEARLDSHPHSA